MLARNSLFVLLLLTGVGFPNLSRRVTRRHAIPRQRLERATARPDLSVEFKSVSALKVVSRKADYQLDEMISLDIALVNTGSHPVFVLNNLDVGGLELEAIDSTGHRVGINTYTTHLEAYTPASYLKLRPGGIITGHLRLIIGQTAQAARFGELLMKADQLEGNERGRRIFDAGLYADRGEAYLDCKQPGSYSITASYHNEFVLVSRDQKGIKTAVGAMTAAPLTITVSK